LNAARRARRAYRGAPFGDRFHVALRWRTCPFRAVEDVLPRKGRILEIGCGHGLFSLYLAAASPDRTVVGVDVDDSKLAVARAATTALGAHSVSFEAREALEALSEPWAGIAIVDVLYLLGADPARAVLKAAAEHVEPGGVLAVKEIDLVPRWKYRLAHAQELVATKVLRITEGEKVDFLPPADAIGVMEDAGLHVETRRVDRGYPYPHLLIVGRA